MEQTIRIDCVSVKMHVKFVMRSTETTTDVALTNAWDAAVNNYVDITGYDMVDLDTGDVPMAEIWRSLHSNSTIRVSDFKSYIYEVEINETDFILMCLKYAE